MSLDINISPELRAKLEDRSSTLNLSIAAVGLVLNLRRVRKHYKKENHKRAAYYAFAAGGQYTLLMSGVTARLQALNEALRVETKATETETAFIRAYESRGQ